MTSRNTFKKGSCELLVLHILNNKGDCYGYEIGQIIRDITNEYLSFPEGSMYPVLYKLIDKGHITDYKKQVGKRLTRVYYHIEPSGQNRLEELTQEYLKTTQSIQRCTYVIPDQRTGWISVLERVLCRSERY